jgi:hypothetical protein
MARTHTRDFTISIEHPDEEVEEDVEVQVEFEITSWGAPATGPSYASGGEPAESPEVEILSVIREDDGADIMGFLPEKQVEKFVDEILDNLDSYEDAPDDE